MRFLKSNPIFSLLNSYLIDSPQPANISSLWHFVRFLGICLLIQIAMLYQVAGSGELQGPFWSTNGPCRFPWRRFLRIVSRLPSWLSRSWARHEGTEWGWKIEYDLWRITFYPWIITKHSWIKKRHWYWRLKTIIICTKQIHNHVIVNLFDAMLK